MSYDERQNLNIDWEYLGELNPKGKIDEATQNAKTAERAAAERDWNINLAWYLGQPWYRRGFRGDVEWIKPEFRDQYFHVNVIFPRVETLIGNELYVPRFEARPKASPQLEDIMRARAAADVANHGVSVTDFQHENPIAHLYKHLFGICWWEVYWDPEAGPLGMSYGAVQCDQCGGLGASPGPMGDIAPCPKCGAEGVIMGRPDLQALPPGQRYEPQGEEPQGDLAVAVYPPWEVSFDPNERDVFKSRWVKHDTDMNKSAALRMHCKDSGIELRDLQDSNPTDSIDRALTSQLPGIEKTSMNRKDTCRVQRFFQLRSVDHPQGLYIVLVGGQVARAGPLPYKHGKLPFVPMRCHVAPLKMYPRSTVDNLMPHAVFMNETLTRMYQRSTQSVQLRMLAARGSAIDMTDVNGLLEFDYKPGRPVPQFISDSGSSPDAANMIGILKDAADSVSFSQDVMRGESEGSQDNARFSAFREQRAVTPLKRMIADNTRTYTIIGRLLCETAKLFYTSGRVIRSVFGSRGHAKFYAFGTTPIGSSDDFEMMPVRDLGRSLASRRAEINEAAQAGVFADPKALKLSEFAVESEMFDEVQTHESAAMMENERFRTGEQADPPSKYENHDVHTQAHTMFLAELRMTLGSQHPVTMAVTQHLDGHMYMKAQEDTEKQMAMQQAAQQYGMQAQATQGTPPASSSGEIVQQGEPSPLETQPSLEQATQQSKVPAQQPVQN